MSSNKSIVIKATAALVLFGSLAIGLRFHRAPDRELSRRATYLSAGPQANIKAESKGNPPAAKTISDSPRSDNSDAYAWLREQITTQASKQGKSKKDVAIDKINEARQIYGSAGGMYSSLYQAFWQEPEVFLEALKATAQGRELTYAIAGYASHASKQNSIEHFEKAYQILNPGGARTSVAESWASIVTRLQGMDQSISLIEKFEIKEERFAAASAAKRSAERKGTVLTAQQLERLNQLKPSR